MNRNKGAIQSAFVVTVSVFTLLVLAVIIVFYVKKQIDQRAVSRKNAKDTAEYGMTIALQKIEEEPSWQQGFYNVKYRDCFYDVRIEKVGDSTFRVQSTGNCQNVKDRVVCTYRLIMEKGALKPKKISIE